MYPMNGRFRKGTSALGTSYVIGRNRVPSPPTRITACIGVVDYTIHPAPATAKVLTCTREKPGPEGKPRAAGLQQSGALDECGEGDDQEAKQRGGYREGVDGELHCAGAVLRGPCRFLEEHVADDAEVVRDREYAVHHERPDDHVDQHRARLGSGQDDPGLPEEAAEGRYPHKGSHEDAHAQRDAGARPDQAVEALCVLPDEVYDEEGAEVHYRVGRGVDQDSLHRCGDCLALQGRECREYVPRVRHRAVGEHPPHVTLPQREEVADEHRQDRQERHDRGPRRRGLGHPFQEHAQERPEEGGLRRDGEEGRGARGGALVGVGGPEVEGSRRDLEGEAGDKEHQPDHRYRGETGSKRICHVGERRRAGDTVDQDYPVEEHGGCYDARDQVLHPTLGALAPTPVEGDHRVRRYRRELYGEEETEQISHRDEQYGAEDDREDEGQVLTCVTRVP